MHCESCEYYFSCSVLSPILSYMHMVMIFVFIFASHTSLKERKKEKKNVLCEIIVFSDRLKIISSTTDNSIGSAKLYFIFRNQTSYSRLSEGSPLLHLLGEDVFQMIENICSGVYTNVKN